MEGEFSESNLTKTKEKLNENEGNEREMREI